MVVVNPWRKILAPAANFFSSIRGSLCVGRFPIEEIVNKVGTPFYVYDATSMREQYRKLISAIPENFTIHYSVKANPNFAAMEVFCKTGSGAEVASAAELEAAIEAGFNPEKIIYAGPGKTQNELLAAVKAGIAVINVESLTELQRLEHVVAESQLRKPPPAVAFRVNIDKKMKDAGESMAGGSRKFGIDAEEIEPLVAKALSSKRLKFVGFHCFAATQALYHENLTEAYSNYSGWVKDFARSMNLDISYMNFGGGFGIPYSDTEKDLDVVSLGKELDHITKELKTLPNFKNTQFHLEPGRYLVGPSGIYVSEVLDIKKSRGVSYAITNGGINHALVPISLNKNFPVKLINKMNHRDSKPIVLAGPLCSSSDQFSRQVMLPEPELGDLVGIFNSGAYGYSASMLAFLSHPTPAEVLVDGNFLYLIRKPKRPAFGGKEILCKTTDEKVQPIKNSEGK
ncbi:MAG TPA: pyridoxal-dependent decarboxylase, exosortase A system-associated [Nitrospinota bacterium]|nr:pyridoxal-dependent decarboxylase, exosortase A system-associated [Anaerolineaceae bacterium]HJM83575.1 pyridoxal-dependent decarboxylase, exosortase A system-associated [Nitrospinota bacterium]|tara:strand:- start:3490 stop:4857 length:1368 start_codon:yes stop_codon:yes gene_type:complete